MLARMIRSNGGTYSGDFTAQCTHLVVELETEASSSRSSPKITFARKWDIPIVKIDWLYESTSKQVCLDDAPYRAESSFLEASQSMAPTQSFKYNDLTIDDVIKENTNLPPYFEGCHFYVGEKGVSLDRLNLLKRLILVAGGTRHSDLFDRGLINYFVVHNQVLGPTEISLIKEFGKDKGPIIVHDQWLFACFIAKDKVPLGAYEVDKNKFFGFSDSQNTLISSKKSTGTSWSLKLSQGSVGQSTLPLQQLAGRSSLSSSFSLPLFAGLSFKLHFCDAEPIKVAQVTDMIEKHGGTISSDSEKADYVVCAMIVRDAHGMDHKKLCNEVWLEQSIILGRVLPLNDPKSREFFLPIVADLSRGNRDGFAGIRVALTGFAGFERDFLGKLANAAGACYTENLTRKNTHLLCRAPPSGPKYEFAVAEKITCCTPAWLLESLKAGEMLDTRHFLVSAESTTASQENAKATSNSADTRGNLGKQMELIQAEIPIKVASDSKPQEEVGASTLPPARHDPDECSEPAAQDVGPILKGLVFAISQRLWHRRDEIHDLVQEMGGTFVWSYDTSCTHYIHQGNVEEEAFREFKTVRQQGKWIISPWWLIKSREAGTRLAESDFAHTYNPENVGLHKQSQPKERGETNEQADPSLRRQDELATPLAETPSDDNISIVSAPIINTAFPANDGDLTLPSMDFSSLPHQNPGRKRMRPMITYSLVEEKTRPIIPLVKARIFALSGLSPEQRKEYPKILKSLNATILESSTSWQPGTTHLIVGKLSRSEKFLAACAVGCWILRPEYVAACVKAGQLVGEREYEWDPSSADEKILSAAPRYWRERLGREKGSAFTNWNVLLMVDQKRQAGLFSILTAGGARVHRFDSEHFSQAIPHLTHIFVSSAQMRSRLPPSVMENVRPECIHHVDYIADYLLQTKSVK